jgi:hypothetical protein
MSTSMMRPLFLLLGALAIGCGDDGDDGDGETSAATFTVVTTDVVNELNCGGPFCHSTIAGGFTLSKDKTTMHSTFLEGSGHAAECMDSGIDYVVPGDPDASLLYLKLTNPPCGKLMPDGKVLDPSAIDSVRAWIEAGAKND